jgi:hypothetical protein
LDVGAIKEGGPMVLMAADIPFSAVADTLLVPIQAYSEAAYPRYRPSLEERQSEPTTATRDVSGD